MPWADNTPCSSDGTRVCHAGKCVSKYIPKPVIHGHWSGWTGWSTCSFSCGRGVRKRKRLCNSPTPQNGGKFCLGPDSSYELCNTNPCNLIKDIRQEQCDVVSLPLRKSSRTYFRTYFWSNLELQTKNIYLTKINYFKLKFSTLGHVEMFSVRNFGIHCKKGWHCRVLSDGCWEWCQIWAPLIRPYLDTS